MASGNGMTDRTVWRVHNTTLNRRGARIGKRPRRNARPCETLSARELVRDLMSRSLEGRSAPDTRRRVRKGCQTSAAPSRLRHLEAIKPHVLFGTTLVGDLWVSGVERLPAGLPRALRDPANHRDRPGVAPSVESSARTPAGTTPVGTRKMVTNWGLVRVDLPEGARQQVAYLVGDRVGRVIAVHVVAIEAHPQNSAASIVTGAATSVPAPSSPRAMPPRTVAVR